MKKVICIDGKPRPKEYSHYPPIQEGKQYTITGQEVGYYTDGSPVKCYTILEAPNWLYEIDRFIPVSEIDETEFQRNYEKEKA
jgi:hypothetical protein